MSVEEALGALRIGQVEVKGTLSALRHEIEEYRQQNDKDHKEIKDQNRQTIKEVKRINGEGTQAGRVWRARFEGAMAGTRVTTAIIWAVVGAAVPTVGLIVSIIER